MCWIVFSLVGVCSVILSIFMLFVCNVCDMFLFCLIELNVSIGMIGFSFMILVIVFIELVF